MDALTRPILTGFELAHFNLGLQLGDLENAEAVRRARGDSGSSISWVVGHLLSYRCTALRACGVEQPNPYEEKFSFQRAATDGSDYPDIAELHRAWNDVHARLREAVSNLDEGELLAESNIPGGDGTLLGALSFAMWHEAYHVGVVGLLRVQWGRRHTHELAMEAMGLA